MESRGEVVGDASSQDGVPAGFRAVELWSKIGTDRVPPNGSDGPGPGLGIAREEWVVCSGDGVFYPMTDGT